MAGIGATLRTARESRGLSIEQAAQETRISDRFIEALEADDFDALPAPVYVRGFLRSYSNYLRVDPEPLLAALREDAPDAEAAPSPGPFATGARPRGVYEPVPDAPAPSLADPGDQWWPEPHVEERGLWPGLEQQPAPAAPVAPVAAAAATARADDVMDPDEDAAEGVFELAAAPGAAAAAGEPRVAYEHDRLRRLRESGILVERDEPVRRAAGGGGSNTKMIVVVGAAVFGLVALVAAALTLTGGDDDDTSDLPAAAGDEATATREGGQVIAVSSATPRMSVTPRPSTTPNPRTPTATPGGEETPQATSTTKPAATKTTSSGGGGPQPTDEPPAATSTPRPPTNTSVPPTNTPVPPTAAPTAIPVPPHANRYGECDTSCGTLPYRVYCAPDGWFVDADKNFDNSGLNWPMHEVYTFAEIEHACG